jgi:hypothetical protein
MSIEMGVVMQTHATARAAADQARQPGRGRKILIGVLVYSVIIAATLFVIDRALIALKLFPPAYNYGHPDVGWVSADPTGKMVQEGCLDLTSKQIIRYTRNEDGIRTTHSASALRQPTAGYKVAVSGDSHTELCVPDTKSHFGIMERELNALGLHSSVFAFGAGKYSPLQAYLAVREPIKQYSANAFVLNLYTGNDFYDMLRVDDRPYLASGNGEYHIADPVWYRLDSPDKKRASRVLFLIESGFQKTGLRRVLLRLHYLRDVAASQNAGVGAVVGYMNDLRKSASDKVEYPHAFSAQMLNQQLFFHHFPGSREESLRRVKALLEIVRKDNPNVLLIMSPVPSYQLVNQQPVDSTFMEVVGKLPVAYDAGVAQEAALYDTLKQLSADAGWVFVDNLAPLRQYNGSELLYNRADYHIEPVASEIIGAAQAREIVRRVGATRAATE